MTFSLGAIEGIAKEGILAGSRTHVHLMVSLDSKVGIRNQVHVLLEISTQSLQEAGEILYQSSKGVVLVLNVPQCAIVQMIPQTKRAKKNIQHLRLAFVSLS